MGLATIFIQYTPDVSYKNQDHLKTILTSRFNGISSILKSYRVSMGELSVDGKHFTATVAEHNVEPLTEALKQHKFEVRRDTTSTAIL